MTVNKLKQGPLLVCFLAFAVTLALACSGKEGGGSSSPPLRTARDSAVAAADALALAQIELTMVADSTISEAMLARAKRPEVRSLAVDVLRDAHALHVAAVQAARDGGINVALPENDVTLSDIQVSMSLITNSPAGANVDGLYLSGIATRDLALTSLVNLRSFTTKRPALKTLYSRVAENGRRHGAAVAELEKKPH